jgi:hypothetical protein
VVLQLSHRGVPEAPLGHVDDPLQGDRVVGVGDHGEVGHGVLDLGPLVELDPAHYLVRHPLAHEHVLQARLWRCPVEDRDLRGEAPLSISFSTSETTNRASAYSSEAANTLMRSPSSPAVHSAFGLREALFATTAFAASR